MYSTLKALQLIAARIIGIGIVLSVSSAQLPADTTHSQLSKAMMGASYSVTQPYLAFNAFNPTPDHRHAGIDYGAPEGRPVRAILGGVVTNVNTSIGSVGIFDGKATVFYLHMKNIRVQKNAVIQFGTPIGSVSKVGTGATHLHIEVRRGYQTHPVGPSSPGSTASLTFNPLSYF
jgi:murein DD-endopeptidase MepM/ murein hydrolase activator NlpD